jgi:hypothetical protein
MIRKLEPAVDELEKLPEKEQDIAADAILDYVSSARPRLSDEHVREVERRLADPNPKFLTLAEARARFKRFGA